MPFAESRLRRLSGAVKNSRRKLEPFRKNRAHALRMMVGSHYSDDGAALPQPINLIEMAVSIYQTQLAANCPQVLVTTPHAGLKAAALDLELALNHLIRHEIDLENTLQRAVVDAMFGMGIIKVGMCKGKAVEIEGYLHDVGQPFADNVSIDDFVFDMAASRWDQAQFLGNRYRLPLELVKADRMFKDADKIKPNERRANDEHGDRRADAMSRGEPQDDDEVYESAEFWDLWLPLDNVVVTVQGADGETIQDKILRTVEWEGPEIGPYPILSYADVPDQIMPLPPVALWRDLHHTVNVLYRKLSRQAERQKKINVFTGGADEDAKRFNDTNDGEWARSDNPQGVNEISMGGIDQSNFGFMVDGFSRFSHLAGNLDVLGGLSPQSDTATQDKLLSENASKRVESMANRTISFTAKVCQSLGFYLFYDPLIEVPIVKQMGGLSLQTTYGPADREGDFLQYNFNIDPQSMKYRSAGERLNTINQFMAQMIMPGLQFIAEQGGTVDWELLVKTYARYTNIPEMADLVRFANPQQQDRGPVGEPPKKAASTTRNYTRTSRVGATRQGKDMAMVQSLMGGGAPQQKEMAGAFRGVG